MFRFINNLRGLAGKQRSSVQRSQSLSVEELITAENYWMSISQEDHFKEEIDSLTSNSALPTKSCLLPPRPLLGSAGILRVGGREQNPKLSFSNLHPAILHGNHPVTKLIIHTEHLRLLHAGPTLLTSSLCRCLHIIGVSAEIFSSVVVDVAMWLLI